MRRINRSLFFDKEILWIVVASPYPLQGPGAIYRSAWARRKSQVFENTVCAGQEACHNIHLNPSVGNQKMQWRGAT